MEVFYALLLFIGGILGGFYASSVGGGSLISLPLLILIGLPIHMVLGTQRLSVAFLGAFSSLKFYKEKKLNLKLAIPLGLTASIGTVIGVITVVHLNEKFLNILIAVLLCIVAFLLLNKDRIGVKEHKLTHKHIFLLFLLMIPIGIYQGFIGAGIGVFSTVLLVLLFGFSFFESAAIGRVIDFCGSIVGAIIFAHYGFINYSYAIALGSGFAIGSWIGIGIAIKRGETYIKGLILFVVILSVIKLILNFFNVNFI